MKDAVHMYYLEACFFYKHSHVKSREFWSEIYWILDIIICGHRLAIKVISESW